ncbi:MAG TPA: hypothetical protein PLR99_15745, partial [Polyangiaceae bacterium]|nr:hypothetical protein [Polyangiaceae bacterium]
MSPLRARLHAAAALLAQSRELLEARAARGLDVAPAALEVRGWTAFLEGLDDAELAALEIGGSAGPWPART